MLADPNNIKLPLESANWISPKPCDTHNYATPSTASSQLNTVKPVADIMKTTMMQIPSDICVSFNIIAVGMETIGIACIKNHSCFAGQVLWQCVQRNSLWVISLMGDSWRVFSSLYSRVWSFSLRDVCLCLDLLCLCSNCTCTLLHFSLQLDLSKTF